MAYNHLHFVQSLETMEGGGLGVSARQLHGAMLSCASSRLVATTSQKSFAEENGIHQFQRVQPNSFYYSPYLANVARDFVSEADYIHGHGLYVYPNFVFGREARRQGKSLIYHIHGFFDPWILGRSKIKKGLVNLLFEKRNLDSVSFIRALTNKEELQVRGFGYRGPIEVIPNGVDLEEIDAVSPEEALHARFDKKRPKRALFLSRLHPKKGLDILIESWAGLGEVGKDWELLIVGPNEGGYQSEIEKMIKERNLGEQCRIMPPVRGLEKHRVFQSADLFVLPSYSEGFPMAVLEALANRKPCVVTSECNVPEMYEEGAVWQCLPNAESFRASLQEALGCGDSERQERGAIGRKMMEESYSWQSVARQLDSACRSHR
ncbi:glycosyltransferase [Roseibacillus ishigakijimensis]|uniref:Glycosyltransferase n=1 Tax=Roseibacillus ishigakijimensis TaxID=454146 RepID=A0A934VKH1_9BACT|nr:glycosyltransferase [Roseibacillus ishigakijimensis]MBK1833644.1 glycosyltransferase [Roseibacillus ishigakijimensis]